MDRITLRTKFLEGDNVDWDLLTVLDHCTSDNDKPTTSPMIKGLWYDFADQQSNRFQEHQCSRRDSIEAPMYEAWVLCGKYTSQIDVQIMPLWRAPQGSRKKEVCSWWIGGDSVSLRTAPPISEYVYRANFVCSHRLRFGKRKQKVKHNSRAQRLWQIYVLHWQDLCAL